MSELKLPFRDRAQDLLSAIDDTRELDGADGQVARRLMTDALLHESKQTVGELLGDLERATREERRERVEAARARAGLRSLSSIEFEAEQRRREAAAPPQRDGSGRALQVCHAADCKAQAVDPTTGAPMPVPERRWFCETHRDQASAHDLEHWRSDLRWSPTRGVVDLKELEADRAREAAELESRRVRREANQAERKEEAAALARYEKAAAEQRRRETPAGLP
jgi:hypothetical protein